MPRAKPSLYLISVLLFMLILPLAFVLIQSGGPGAVFGWPLIGKWLVFWAVGVRLFIAGIRQVSKPAFTATEIFHMSSDESHPVIIELGFSNISIGLLGILTLVKSDWCAAAAITGGLYFGLAGLLHIVKKPAGRNEVIAMISDLYIFALLTAYLFFTLPK